MTIRQDKMIAELDRQLANNEPINIRKSAKKANYSPKYINGSLYNDIRKQKNPVCKWIQEYVGRDRIYKDIRSLESDSKEAGDRSTRARMLELRSKIGKLDQSSQVNVFQQFNIDALDRLDKEVPEPIDTKQDTQDANT